ncbi:hypothetical protein SAMN05660199_00788 [Klenkia soli]|uniref:Uncharacterized protein n=1 Tax=Klenkia soli TaxID=1052260 RepID=A0A1H0ELS2_9ACTN|nr:hypothetical protein [Klenkia soli]SDN83266.1 hypothetical protein SAMN05660199_00788 [Klenkia soli]
MTTEDDVRTALHRAADDLGHPVVPHRVLAAGLRETGRRRRRRRIGIAAAGVAVAVVVTAVPVGIAALRTDPPTTATPVVPEVDVLGLAPRGSLAGDRAFLDALVQQPWVVPGTTPEDAPDAPVATRRVAFAGDVPGGRWALVVGENPTPSTLPAEQQTDLGAMSGVAGVWFVGPVGAAADQLAPVTYPRGLPTDQVQSLSDPATGTVVVLAAPGDEIALSDRPDIAADATVTRTWTDVGAADGLGVGALPVGDVGGYRTAGQYRVTRDGIVVQRQSPDQLGRQDDAEVPVIPIDHPRGSVPGADLMDQVHAAELLGTTGLSIAEVGFQVVWSGAIPGPDDDPTYATVLVATLPSGAMLVQGTDLRDLGDGGYGGGVDVLQLFPAGAPTDLVVAMRTAVSGDGGRGTVTSLVVAVPDGAVQVTALDEDGGRLGTFPVAGGAAVAPFPDGTTAVEVAFADGSTRTAALGSYTGDL